MVCLDESLLQTPKLVLEYIYTYIFFDPENS